MERWADELESDAAELRSVRLSKRQARDIAHHLRGALRLLAQEGAR